MRTLRESVHDYLDYDPAAAGTGEKLITIGFTLLIVANVIAVILQSDAAFDARYSDLFWAFEVFSVAIFTVEYLLRIWSITADPAYADPVRGRLRYMATPLAIIDLLSVLPFYLPFLIPVDLRTLRMLRLFRLLRLFKVGHYSESFEIFARVLEKKKADLVITFVVILMLLVISSGLMYSVENEAQPEEFPSIIAAMWWTFATITTIGYGDVVPVTAVGRVLAAITAVIGIALFGLPAGIFAAGFIEELQAQPRPGLVCPHCGEPLGHQDRDEEA